MSPDHDEIRKRLTGLKAEIEALLGTADDERDPAEFDQQSVGRLSRMDALQRHEMAKAKDAARRRELNRIAAALRRLDDGDYGFCIDCDEKIPERRLQIDPMAERCVACAGGTR